MMRAHRLLILAGLLGCAGHTAIRPIRPTTEPPAAAVIPASVDSLLASMTPRDKIGQLIVPWLAGSYTAFDDSSFQVAERWVDSLRVRGVILSVSLPFGHRPK